MFKDRLVEEALSYTIEVLSRLISIPTVAPAGEKYGEAAELLLREISSLGLESKLIEVPMDYQRKLCKEAGESPRYIVLGRWGSGSKRLHFNAHYDVVPGGGGWTVTEPFKPVVKDGKVYGRGASDMKGGLAATLGAVRLLRTHGYEPALSLELAFVPDEEIGGRCGTGYLVEIMERMPDYVILPEPSGLSNPWHGHRGILWANVKVLGKSAHASMPWLGKNAFLLASQLALELNRALAPALSARRSKYEIDPPEAAMPTIAIGGYASVPGGGKTNQIPSEFVFSLDRRLIPEESVSQALGELRHVLSLISQQIGAEYELEVTNSMEPAINEPGELYEALRRAARLAGVELGRPVICPGGLDMWYYTTKGSKALALGPEKGSIHGPDEYVSIEDLRRLIITFAALPLELAKD